MHKNAQIRWDDVIVILAVVDHGSVAAAARALGINHATILRRIADFEARASVRMFNKTTRGYQISPDRRDVVNAMREAAEALGAVDRMMDNVRPNLSDGVRITTTDSLAQYVLPPLLPAVIAQSGAAIEVMVDNAHIDLSRRQAYVTVRPAIELPPELDGLPAGAIRFGVFAPKTGKTDAWLGLTGPLARSAAAAWIAENAEPPQAYGDSFLALAAMAAAGLGRTILPSFVGDAWPELVCLDQSKTMPQVPVWVGAHVDFARSQRIRRTRQHLADALAATPQLSH